MKRRAYAGKAVRLPKRGGIHKRCGQHARNGGNRTSRVVERPFRPTSSPNQREVRTIWGSDGAWLTNGRSAMNTTRMQAWVKTSRFQRPNAKLCARQAVNPPNDVTNFKQNVQAARGKETPAPAGWSSGRGRPALDENL